MTTVKRVLNLTMIILFISLTSNINVFANSMVQNESQTVLFNSNFEVTINGIKYTVITPLSPSSAPVTVKIIDNGEVLFQQITRNFTMVVGDGIDHRVVGDGIDHRVTSDSIEHSVLEISQNGLVLLSSEL